MIYYCNNSNWMLGYSPNNHRLSEVVAFSSLIVINFNEYKLNFYVYCTFIFMYGTSHVNVHITPMDLRMPKVHDFWFPGGLCTKTDDLPWNWSGALMKALSRHDVMILCIFWLHCCPYWRHFWILKLWNVL